MARRPTSSPVVKPRGLWSMHKGVTVLISVPWPSGVDLTVVVHRKEKFPMKKLMTFMLGLALLTTTVVAVSARDTTPKKAKNKQKKPKPNSTKPKPNIEQGTMKKDKGTME
jgi:hypothetical protein